MGIISSFTFSLLFQVFLFIILPWANRMWNFMLVFGLHTLESQSHATEKENLSADWPKSGDCLLPSVLQRRRRRGESPVVRVKSPAEKVGMRLS